MGKWRKSKHLYGPEKVAESTDNMNKAMRGAKPEYETCLAGYHGEIWEYDDEHYKVVITSSKLANGIAKSLGDSRVFKRGDEAVFKIPKIMLPDAFKWARIPKSHSTRVRLANNFRKSKICA